MDKSVAALRQQGQPVHLSAASSAVSILATITAVMVIVVAPLMGCPSVANAADITGSWASDVNVCDKIFQMKGGIVSLANRSDTLGGGFVIDGASIRGKVANCKIKTRKQDGDLVHLIAACATDVMLSNFELTLKIIDGNRIARVFPGMPEMETPYYRCPR